MSSNIPSAPAYEVYLFQLVRYARKVQVDNDQEKAQSEKKIPTPKTEAGKTKLTIRY